MKKLLVNIVLFSGLLMLVACNHTPDGKISWQPESLDLTPPPGPPEYEKGWSDGCESAANAYSNSVYKMFKAFKFKMDATMVSNKMYHQVWKDAFLYCSIYWERTNQENL